VILTAAPQKSQTYFMPSDYYTYAYLREDKTPYYIGKGRGNRAYDKGRTIKPPKDKSRIIFLKKNLTEVEAFKHEIYMIFVFGRKDLGTGILRNLTNGGEGSSGAVVSEETKKKLSEANSGENNAQFGAPKTEEQRKKQSVAMSGENHPQYGKTGALHHNSKAIIAIQPDGTELQFGGVREAARELGVNQSNLCHYLKTGRSPIRGKFKGWRFAYENS
jgi:hypothetical protein